MELSKLVVLSPMCADTSLEDLCGELLTEWSIMFLVLVRPDITEINSVILMIPT